MGDKPEFKDETPEQAVVRECKEEIGITISDLTKVGELIFIFIDENGEKQHVLCHTYFSDSYVGEITGSDEMLTPTWFTIKNFPWDKIWPNDRVWLEDLLTKGMYLDAVFVFDPKKGLIANETQMKWSQLSCI